MRFVQQWKIPTSESIAEDGKVEWKTKTARRNDNKRCLFSPETSVSIESRAAASLIKKGVAEAIEDPGEEVNEKEVNDNKAK